MKTFDATQGAQISKQIQEVVQRPLIGRVVKVFEHVQDDDKSNFEVDVKLLGSREAQLRSVPWQAPHDDEVKVPIVGDKVMVEYRGQTKKIPIARNAVYTNQDRPPKAGAGTWRKRVKSEESPAGSGDLYIESYTEYDSNPAQSDFEPGSATPLKSFIRLGKKADDLDDTRYDDTLPMLIELFDSPEDDEANIRIQGNAVDKDSSKTMDIDFDLKEGIMRFHGVNGGDEFQLQIDVDEKTARFSGDGTNEMGFWMNFDTDEFKMLDGEGYGIQSDGAGNFTWFYESIDHKQGTKTSLP